MNMNSIKEECESLYKVMADSRDRLEEIRKSCPHKEFVIGHYEWRTGSINKGFICTDCGKFITATN